MSCSVRLRLLVPIALSLVAFACSDDASDDHDPFQGGPETCLTLEAECSQFASCVYDDEGAPRCVCDFGFSGDGLTCTEIAQCEQDGYCDANATCHSIERDADFCLCNDGFVDVPGADRSGETCVDIDECFDHPCDEHAACTNTPGGYTCACDASKGYQEDDDPYTTPGTVCVDLDECAADVDDCDEHAFCTNTVGGFTCACNGDIGYTEDKDPETRPGTVCVDIDECEEGLDDCDEHATCTNAPGGFSCACRAPFIEDDDPGTRPGTVCLEAI